MRILLELWPALLPLVIYLLWKSTQRRRAVKSGQEAPRWKDGPWFWTLMTSIGTVIVFLFALGAFTERQKGEYVPPHMENGELVPGKVNR